MYTNTQHHFQEHYFVDANGGDDELLFDMNYVVSHMFTRLGRSVGLLLPALSFGTLVPRQKKTARKLS